MSSEKTVHPESHETSGVRVAPSEDGLLATLHIMGTDVGFEDAMQALAEHGVRFGIDEEAVRKIVGEAAGGKGERSEVVAHGVAPGAGADAQVEYRFPVGLKEQKEAQRFRTLLGTNDPETIKKAQSRVPIVHEGDVLAIRTPATEGTPGMSVLGEEIPGIPGNDVELNVGEYTIDSKDGSKVIAERFGGALLENAEISVLSPIWVAEDVLEAYFLLGAGSPPTAEEMQAWIAESGIVYGLDENAVAQVVAGNLSTPVCIAKGLLPTAGKDAQLRFSWEQEDGSKAGKVRADGSIDFREHSNVVNVHQGELLIEKVPAAKGTPGRTVRGDEIRAVDGKDEPLSTGENTRMEQDEAGVTQMYSEIDGRAAFAAGKLSVFSSFEVAEDVDYSTGNIKFIGDVTIKGSVLPGFVVEATGNVAVRGDIESAKSVKAGGDITAKGIIGSNRVEAGGTITAEFAENSHIEAQGDVVVRTALINTSVTCGGAVKCLGKSGLGQSGVLVGGTIFATHGIEARTIGSSTNSNTQLIAGIDLEKQNEVIETERQLKTCEEKLAKLETVIGENMTLESLQPILKHLPAKRKNEMISSLKEMITFKKIKKKLEAALASTQQEDEGAGKAVIRVHGTLFEDVKVQIGKEMMHVTDRIQCKELSGDPKKGEIVESALK
jgi:uncharacterized protein (DUF342 family)